MNTISAFNRHSLRHLDLGLAHRAATRSLSIIGPCPFRLHLTLSLPLLNFNLARNLFLEHLRKSYSVGLGLFRKHLAALPDCRSIMQERLEGRLGSTRPDPPGTL